MFMLVMVPYYTGMEWGMLLAFCGGLVGLCGRRRLLHGLYLVQEGGHGMLNVCGTAA